MEEGDDARRRGHGFQTTVINGGIGPVNVQLGDRYLYVDGNSMEASALALALFPAMEKIIETHIHNAVTQNAEFLYESLKNQQVIFRQSLHRLLASLVSDDELNRLLNDWTDAKWKERQLRDGIVASLGDEAQGLLETANGICKTLSKLMQKLQGQNITSDSGYLAYARKVIKSFCAGSNTRANAASLRSLKADIAEFQRLTQDLTTQSILSTSRSEAERHLQRLELVRRCAENLYTALREEFQCNCNQLHPANIELDTWSAQVQNVTNAAVLRFSFLLADSAENASYHQWMTAEVQTDGEYDTDQLLSQLMAERSPRHSESSYGTSHSQPIIEDGEPPSDTPSEGLCDKLRSSSPFSHTVDSAAHHVNRRISMTSDIPTSIAQRQSFRLADGLGRSVSSPANPNALPSWLQLRIRHRIHLGLMLAWGVLQISSTGWLEGYWTIENILLVKDAAEKPRPYVTHRFESSRSTDDAIASPTLTPLVPHYIALWTRSSVLFALGIFLIEIGCDSLITQLAYDHELAAGEDGLLHTALRLKEEIRDQFGLRYAEAVDACLNAPVRSDAQGNATDLTDFGIYVHTKIVQPLQEAASHFGDR